MVDVDKYKEELSNSRSENSSPDKVNREESDKNEGGNDGSNQF